MEFHTSGTTGQYKMFNMSWELRYARAERLTVSCPELQDAKSILCMYPVGTTASDKFKVFAATRNIPFTTAYRDGMAFDAVVGPSDVLGLLYHHRPPKCSFVQTSGDFISPLDFDAIVALGEVACSIYGVSEVGSISRWDLNNGFRDDGYVGPVMSDVQVKIEGRDDIAVKTPTMVDKYRDPWKHNSYFIDGWFYPGDRGELLKDGLYLKRRVR